MRRKARDQAVGVATMALGRVTLGHGDPGEAEGERQDSRNGKNIPLQKHLPTDFAG
jgi:hypothetical protein